MVTYSHCEAQNASVINYSPALPLLCGINAVSQSVVFFVDSLLQFNTSSRKIASNGPSFLELDFVLTFSPAWVPTRLTRSISPSLSFNNAVPDARRHLLQRHRITGLHSHAYRAIAAVPDTHRPRRIDRPLPALHWHLGTCQARQAKGHEQQETRKGLRIILVKRMKLTYFVIKICS